MRREDTIATGGSIAGIAAGLRRVAGQVSNDPERIRADIEAEIDRLRAELDALDEGRRPSPTRWTSRTRRVRSHCRWNRSSPTSGSTARC